MHSLQQSNLDFLKALSQNNNREWFSEHKEDVEANMKDFKAFFAEVEKEMNQVDHLEKFHMYRIYRDVRFSKDKTPYKNHIGFHIARTKPLLRGGYYIHIEPGNSFVAGGLWAPNKEDLFRLRQEIEADADSFREVLNQSQIKDFFGELKGEELKTGPRDFDKNSPNLDLLKKKQFYLQRNFDDKSLLREDFVSQIVESFLTMRPLFDLFSEVLTHDSNGVPLYE
ncbi:DUF2461 domain-containing protein [Myroides sp. LJL115]